MTQSELKSRWKSLDPRVIAEVLRFLRGKTSVLPGEIGEHDGRADLRGFHLEPPRAIGSVVTGGHWAELLSGLESIRDAHWEKLDLSYSRLRSLRFTDTVIANCRFDEADCTDWRLWHVGVIDTSFAGAKMRDGALGTWINGQVNSWQRAVFQKADLRGVRFFGGNLVECEFNNSSTRGLSFVQLSMKRCVFAGSVQEVLFDGRDIEGNPPAGILDEIDFSSATFTDVDFRGCRVRAISVPNGVYVVENFPEVARRAAAALKDEKSESARVLLATLDVDLLRPGRPDSVGIVNLVDYEIWGGKELAGLAKRLLVDGGL